MSKRFFERGGEPLLDLPIEAFELTASSPPGTDTALLFRGYA
jgi:hypothetical protein